MPKSWRSNGNKIIIKPPVDGENQPRGDTGKNTDENRTVEEEETEKALENDLRSLEVELTKQRDVYLRLAADFDNFRKRTAQEVERRAAAQKEAFIRELLPVIDNLERALSSGTSSTP